MRTGRPRVPSALKRARGTYQPCREAPNALTVPPGVPPVPRGLTGEARRIWLEHVNDEEWRVVLARGDGAGLEVLVKHLALERKYAAAALRQPMVRTAWGLKPNPAAAQARLEAGVVKNLLQEFGLTPAARSRVSVPQGTVEQRKQEKATADFLFGGMQVLPGGKTGA